VFVAGKDRVNLSRVLNNLAWLLRGDPQRLNEARDFATEALAIDQTLDPGAAEIWKTYDVLADIATQAGDTKAARRHRALGRKAHAAAPMAREALRRQLPIIGTVLAVVRQPSGRPELERMLSERAERGWGNLVGALRALLDGQREEDALCDPLDREDALIVMTVLRCLADPEAERALFSDQT
jgi:hypothetical protein